MHLSVIQLHIQLLSTCTLPNTMAVVVGYHPNHSQSQRDSDVLDEHWEHILQLLRSSRVAAVGEVGLDHSAPPESWHAQMASLERFLTVVNIDKVLVLHCRWYKSVYAPTSTGQKERVNAAEDIPPLLQRE